MGRLYLQEAEKEWSIFLNYEKPIFMLKVSTLHRYEDQAEVVCIYAENDRFL